MQQRLEFIFCANAAPCYFFHISVIFNSSDCEVVIFDEVPAL